MKNILIAALLLGIAGCATGAPAPSFSSALRCAPAGYENLTGWQLRDITHGMAEKTDGAPQPITSVVLSRGERVIVMVFAEKDLILVDPNPQDQGVPVLVNSRFFNRDNQLLTEPSGPACEWRPLLNGESA